MTTKRGWIADLELMLYADGELDGERRAAVEERLARDRGARDKLAALGVASTIVQEEARNAAGKADGIAGTVMDLIDAEAARPPAGKPEPSAASAPRPAKAANATGAASS